LPSAPARGGIIHAFEEDTMKRLHLAAALACLLGAGAPALAQTTAGVADPQAAVPATPYASPIRRDTPAAASPSPDQAWRAANATVGGRNAMSLTMPGMGGMSGHEMHGAAPAAPAATPATPAPASGHVHHAGMQMGDAAAAGPQCGAGMQCMGAAADQQCMAGGGAKGCCGDKGCGGGTSAAGEHTGHAGHAGHAGMAMGAAAAGQQCTPGASGKNCCGDKCCCAGDMAAGEHAGHAGMAMNHGCCDHKEAK